MDRQHTLGLGDVARENRRSRPHATAVVDGATRLTYLELDDRANRLANALAAEGTAAGDRVLWAGQTSFRVLELLLACGKLGAVLCPANWRLSGQELAFVLDDLRPHVVVWQEAELGPRLAEARKLAEHQAARWIRHDGTGPDSYEDWLQAAPASDAEAGVDPTAPVLALYTAAFDGRPNAALLSHQAILTHNLALALQRQIEPGFVYLNSGPLFHVGTLMFCTATFHLGGTNVFMPTFDPATACALIEAERCQSALLFPPMVDELVKANADRRYDLSSLKVAPGGDEWDAMVTLDQSPWGRALGGYGQTEVAGMATFGGQGIGGLGTHGRPSPFLQVRLVDEDGSEVPTGEVGEIVARGPHVMNGYFNRPELNAVRRRGGWHHTGDLGRRETDGTITFIGPRLRVIKTGGENVYAAEVERAVRNHPAVADVAVIGVPDPIWGQSVKAVVVPAPGSALTEAEVIEHCRSLIASYKKPRTVTFADSIPKRGFAADYDLLDVQYQGGGYPGSTGEDEGEATAPEAYPQSSPRESRD
ncbi:AMP-binding protein [Streptomyces spiralis]|uniref:AMP-binding protein n=1 Tax=Streptomyces spiralis TaxID=66376 RepID=UPI003402D7E2